MLFIAFDKIFYLVQYTYFKEQMYLVGPGLTSYFYRYSSRLSLEYAGRFRPHTASKETMKGVDGIWVQDSSISSKGDMVLSLPLLTKVNEEMKSESLEVSRTSSEDSALGDDERLIENYGVRRRLPRK